MGRRTVPWNLKPERRHGKFESLHIMRHKWYNYNFLSQNQSCRWQLVNRRAAGEQMLKIECAPPQHAARCWFHYHEYKNTLSWSCEWFINLFIFLFKSVFLNFEFTVVISVIVFSIVTHHCTSHQVAHLLTYTYTNNALKNNYKIVII